MSIEVRKTADGRTYYYARVKSGRQLVATRAFDTRREAAKWERIRSTGSRRVDRSPKRSFTLGNWSRCFSKRERRQSSYVDTDRDNNRGAARRLARAPLIFDPRRRHPKPPNLPSSRKKPSTVAREKTTLSALFTYAAEQGLLHQPHPVRTMKKIPELSATNERAISPKDYSDASPLVHGDAPRCGRSGPTSPTYSSSCP